MRIIFLLALLCPYFSMCQPLSINGKIVNDDMDPVPGATILLKRTGVTTRSDSSGRFSLSALYLNDTLIVSAVGYQPVTKAFNFIGGDYITIILKTEHTLMDDVMISTGYQRLRRERSTGSFEIVGKELLNRSITTNWLDRLEGVTTIYFDKRQGTTNRLSLRGRSTIFGNASPLIILDDFPYEGDFNNINPNDIESVTILKDAAAASIWGSRAANGVIVLTTKTATSRQSPRWNVNISTTIGEKPDLFYQPVMSASDFIDTEIFLFEKGYYNGILNNRTVRPIVSPVVEILNDRRQGLISEADAANQIDAFRSTDIRNDFLKYLYRQSAATQYAANVNGGTEEISYYASLGYDKNRPNLVRNESDRLSFNSKLSLRPAKWLNLAFTTGYAGTYKAGNNNGTGLPLSAGKTIYPYATLKNTDGSSTVWPKDYRLRYTDTAGAGKLTDWSYRPLDELYLSNNTTGQSEFRIAGKISAEWTKVFSTDLLYQFQKQTVETNNLLDQESYIVRNLYNKFYNPATGQSAVPAGDILDKWWSSLTGHAGRFQLNFTPKWKNSELNVVGGAEIRQVAIDDGRIRLYGYDPRTRINTPVNLADRLPVYDRLASSQTIPDGYSFTANLQRSVSLFSSAAYTVARKYTFSLSGRKDASNLFGVDANQKWVPLWSTGFSWNIAQEDFFSVSALRRLRFRITYGYNGNVDNTLSAETSLLNPSVGAMFTGLPYVMIVAPPNPQLRWERTGVLNIGTDFEFSKLLSGSVEYFRKDGRDIIGQAPVDPTTGVQNNHLESAYRGNVASLQSSGVDVSLNLGFSIGSVSVVPSLIFSYVNNKVKDYYPPVSDASAFVGNAVVVNPAPGKPLFSTYGYYWAGLDPATGEPLGYLNGQPSKAYQQLNYVPIEEAHYHGSAVPTIYGSYRNHFSYGRFAFSFNLVYKMNYFFVRRGLIYSSLFQNWIGHADFERRWQKPGDEAFTQIPSMRYPVSNARENFYAGSDALVERGDHIRLQDLAFSWQIPFKPELIRSLTLQAYINNVGILWRKNKLGIDPDYPSSGYPLPRNYSLALRMNF